MNTTIKVDIADFQSVINIAKGNPDHSLIKQLNQIREKYNYRVLVNDIREKMFAEVEKIPKNTPQNKIAYQKYKTFSDFAENMRKNLGTIDYSDIEAAINNKVNELQ